MTAFRKIRQLTLRPFFLRHGFRAHLAWLRFTKRVTLGCRIIVVTDNQIVLVRHTYYPGWTLPGGGVDRGETFGEAARRELWEECGLQANKIRLLGIHLNRKRGRVDHVATYVVEGFQGELKTHCPREIAEVRFFPLSSLPPDLVPGHRRRIDEWMELSEISELW